MSMHTSIMLSNIFSQGEPNQSVTEKLFRWVERDLRHVRRGLESLNPGPGPLQSISAGVGHCQSASERTAIRLVGGTDPA